MADPNKKHPAEVLAERIDGRPDFTGWAWECAEMLRRIPALEAERDRLLAALKAYDAWASKTPPRDAELYKIRQQMGQAILACETKEPK